MSDYDRVTGVKQLKVRGTEADLFSAPAQGPGTQYSQDHCVYQKSNEGCGPSSYLKNGSQMGLLMLLKNNLLIFEL